MQSLNDPHKNVTTKKEKFVKESIKSKCCGPTCCSGSNDKKDNNRKEK